jgi:hypothetical protein
MPPPPPPPPPHLRPHTPTVLPPGPCASHALAVASSALVSDGALLALRVAGFAVAAALLRGRPPGHASAAGCSGPAVVLTLVAGMFAALLASSAVFVASGGRRARDKDGGGAARYFFAAVHFAYQMVLAAGVLVFSFTCVFSSDPEDSRGAVAATVMTGRAMLLLLLDLVVCRVEFVDETCVRYAGAILVARYTSLRWPCTPAGLAARWALSERQLGGVLGLGGRSVAATLREALQVSWAGQVEVGIFSIYCGAMVELYRRLSALFDYSSAGWADARQTLPR